MSLIRDLYSRFQGLIHEVAKFGIVGVAGAIVQFSIQDPLHLGLGLGALTAQCIGVLAGIVVTFIGNRYWTYRDRRSHGREFYRETLLFLVMSGTGMGIQEGLQAISTYGLNLQDGVSYNVATVFGIGIATLFRLYAYRTFVFREATPSGEAMEELEPEIAA